MEQQAALNDDGLLSTAGIIASGTSRAALQQMLLESRVLPRNTSREELRKKCPTSTAWIELVKNQLGNAEGRIAAFRALGGLATSYLSNSKLDHRVETALRKSRQAADRSDIERLDREIRKLADLGLELQYPELQIPGLLVYLIAGSTRARDSVAQAIKESLHALRLTPIQPTQLSAILPQLQVSVASVAPFDSVDPSVADLLSQLTSMVPQVVPPEWNLASVAATRLPQIEAGWPNADEAESSVEALVETCRSTQELLSSKRLSLPIVREVLNTVQDMSSSISERFTAVKERLDELSSAVRTEFDCRLESIVAELQEETVDLRAKLGSNGERYPIHELESLLNRNRSVVEEKLNKLLSITDKIAFLAGYLPQESQQGLELKSRHLLLNFRQEELLRLLQETEVKTEEPRRLFEQMTVAATTMGKFLKRCHGLELQVQTSQAIIAAVKEGNAEKAIGIATAASTSELSAPAKTVVDQPPPSVSVRIATPAIVTPALRGISDPLTNIALQAELSGFAPRDRVLAKDPALPKNADELVRFLLSRAFVEMEKGSVAGATDHALDILHLTGLATGGKDYWSNIALVVLAALPAPGALDSTWGPKMVRALSDSFANLDHTTLANYFAILVTQPRFDEAISERFGHAETAPFVDLLTSALYSSVAYKPYLLEDIARSLGSSAAYGDVTVSRSLLCALAKAAVEGEDTIIQLARALSDQRRHTSLKNNIPEWLVEGVTAFGSAVEERDRQLIRGTSKSSVVRALVPPSVSHSGGFAITPGSEELEFALLLSNHQNRSLSGVELTVPTARNPWLAEDVVCAGGPLGVSERRLVQVRAKLSRELPQDGRLEVGMIIRYKEPGSRESRYEDFRTDLKFLKSPNLAIQSYEGAGGKPIILDGDALRFSSSSVKKALAEISAGLNGTGIAALVIGRRRRGKTSILQTIAQHRDIRSKYTIVCDSWEDLPSKSISSTFRRLGNVFDRAARSLNVEIDPLERRIELDINSGWTVIQQWVGDFTSKLPSPTHLLLLIDEFQKWISLLDAESRTRILSVLRGLFNRPEGGHLSISIVLSGLSNIREFTRTSADFENAFQIFNIEAFSLSEADALVRSNPTIEFDTRAVTQMRHLSGGNPFLINLLGNDIAARLREQGRTYCLPEDVDRVVQAQLDDKENSRVWNFLQYLLKEGEEDHAAQISELPTLIALAYTFRMRGTGRKMISVDEIASEMQTATVECDRATLLSDLQSAVRNELLVQGGSRFAFANGWLAEWLAVSERLLPVTPKPDEDLVLGRFKIVQFIDRGGQASVYEAQDTRAFSRPVIVKIYPRTQQEGMASSVMREAKLLHAIDHNAVVKCIEFGPDPVKGDVIVLERVKGETLRQILQSRPKYATDLIGAEGNLRVQVKFIEQLASALSECHRVGVVHKDLKPENMIVQESAGIWLPKIIDFGLATNISEVGSDTRTIGSYTPGYVAPERYRGESRRAPADIYSLGVVTYELLTGIAPFPSDSLLAREAQESGNFVPAKDRRQELPTRLSELIAEMMSPDPLARPNAFTLVGRLAPALHASDWTAEFESAKRAYLEGDAETAFEYFERAAFSAPEQGRRSAEYLEVLDYLVDTADTCGRLLSVAPEVIQPLAAAALSNEKAIAPFESLIRKLLKEPATDPARRDFQRTAVHTLVQLLIDVPPGQQLARAVEQLLRSVDHPAVWADREDIFLIGLGYREAGLANLSLVGAWCLTSSRKLRERDATLLHAQIWLRRAERIGVAHSPEYRRESEALERLLRSTATPQTLPKLPESQDRGMKAVGEDEKGHLDAKRISMWVERLLSLHPYVQGVRRVRRDPKLPLSPTRLLSLDHLAQHVTQAMAGIDSARIIPAVLDDSYCSPKGATALRINIVLPGGTTLAQREAVMEILREDNSLFGEKL
jgi:tRNA A-37 threonylcarbamoyl transferase component Bud32